MLEVDVTEEAKQVALYRYELTGELYDDDEILDFLYDDITDLEVRSSATRSPSRAGSKRSSAGAGSTRRRTRTRNDPPSSHSAMSRGPGKVEQAIIDAVAREPGALIPLWEIAADHGYDVTVRNAMHSWRRGAHNLAAQGLIEEHWVWPSGYANTQMMCVSTPDCDADVDDDAVRQRCEKMLASRQAQMVTEAEFVWDRIRAGSTLRGKQPHRQAGGPPPGVAQLAELSSTSPAGTALLTPARSEASGRGSWIGDDTGEHYRALCAAIRAYSRVVTGPGSIRSTPPGLVPCARGYREATRKVDGQGAPRDRPSPATPRAAEGEPRAVGVQV